MSKSLNCKSEIERMLKNSQTKVLMPVVTLALIREYIATKKKIFSDSEIRKYYNETVRSLKKFLGHDLHIGAKYEDAYGSRMSRYGVLEAVSHLHYQLLSPYIDEASELAHWLPERIKQHIDFKLGVVPSLDSNQKCLEFAEDREKFCDLIREQISRTPANFEVFSFAVMKIHLEKFACKIYRDTRTASHDHGVDLSTNFGVVYQVKKLKIYSKIDAEKLHNELKLNFDSERLQNGNVILIIDDIDKDIRQYLVQMKVQSLTKDEILRLASNFNDVEDRQKVLRIVHEEFRREYSSRVS